ncbi:dual specificity protein phosphatase family protein [Hoyosella sp. G463]|uniref:Dual specificity protein phosphatase family protein n=1 Tax=Lolliginicoccus lacisalsi TaxID=2742202 RepID=A0A927JC97_9ACTN|nr:dual specificity protein phosphatase family protein [Lolliginicoccus lacisalsi]MBD8506564.1 dual specificity protein phosphatase family protein [Lolliginicoccus lacisalsi]
MGNTGLVLGAGMGELSLVRRGLWIGRAPEHGDPGMPGELVGAYARHGIRSVVDLRADADDSAFWGAGGIEYFNHGIEDSGAPIPFAWFSIGVEHILDRWVGHRKHLLVHCEHGAHRSPSLVYAVLLVLGHRPEVAEHIVLRARPDAFLRYADDAVRWFEHYSGTPPAT